MDSCRLLPLKPPGTPLTDHIHGMLLTCYNSGHGIGETSPHEVSSFDQRGRPIPSDGSFIDRAGWMYDSRREDKKQLFWVPKENRGGFWWPRNTTVIHRTVTKIDFSRFAHGENWTECHTDTD